MSQNIFQLAVSKRQFHFCLLLFLQNKTISSHKQKGLPIVLEEVSVFRGGPQDVELRNQIFLTFWLGSASARLSLSVQFLDALSKKATGNTTI
jgi:hypothetical protein